MRWVAEEGKRASFNGRQIRNLVSTAMSLAHSEERKLMRCDLVTVATNTKEFNSALADRVALYMNSQVRTKYC